VVTHFYNPSYMGDIGTKTVVLGWSGQKREILSENNLKQNGLGA
jgi:hypothetical protein